MLRVKLTLRVEQEQFEALKQYLEITGCPVNRAIGKAIDDFIECTVDTCIEARSLKNVVCITDKNVENLAATLVNN